jgi:hypothetical protein
LGACEAPVLWSEGETGNRYVACCEKGVWEIAPEVDEDGNIESLRQGAQGIEPETSVLRAAHDVLELWADWDDVKFSRLFAPTWDAATVEDLLAERRRAWGECSIERIDLASARGALFDLSCTASSPAGLKLHLNDGDQIAAFALFAAREDRPSCENPPGPTDD